MSSAKDTQHRVAGSFAGRLYASVYRALAYFSLFSLAGAVLWGFRYDPASVPINYAYNVGLYAIFLVPHLIMTRAWFKKAVWGYEAGHPRERRFYILVTTVMWLGVVWLHRPVPGGEIVYPGGWEDLFVFVGTVLFLMFLKLFFEGFSLDALDGFLGVPGSVAAFSHGPETPLFTEGRYAQVRHPMYQSLFLMGFASLLVHPHLAQLFWVAIIGLPFLLFIPVEEAQMIAARGDDYRNYMKQTPWRLIPGIW